MVNNKPEFIYLWQKVQKISISGLLIVTVLSVILKHNIFYVSYVPNQALSILLPALLLLLSAGIIVGITKQLKLGYYLSVLYVLTVMAISLVRVIVYDKAVDIVFIILLSVLLYYLHKERFYFK